MSYLELPKPLHFHHFSSRFIFPSSQSVCHDSHARWLWFRLHLLPQPVRSQFFCNTLQENLWDWAEHISVFRSEEEEEEVYWLQLQSFSVSHLPQRKCLAKLQNVSLYLLVLAGADLEKLVLPDHVWTLRSGLVSEYCHSLHICRFLKVSCLLKALLQFSEKKQQLFWLFSAGEGDTKVARKLLMPGSQKCATNLWWMQAAGVHKRLTLRSPLASHKGRVTLRGLKIT